MSTKRHRLERGDISELAIVMVIGLFVVIGLVVDGGAKMSASAEASTIAQDAGRAGAQPVASLPTDGQPAVLDSRAAAGTAQSYLDQAGVTGSVRVIDQSTLEVTVTSSEKTVFLGLIGINTVSSTRTARVDLIQGQTEVIP